MPTELEVIPMTGKEARKTVNRIKEHLEDARGLILDLYDREGWKALGYRSWRQCVQEEFGQSQTYLYNQLAAAKIEREIAAEGNSSLEENPSIPETHLRPLQSLPEGERKPAWEEAKAQSNGRMTAAKVQQVVDRRRNEQAALVEPEPIPEERVIRRSSNRFNPETYWNNTTLPRFQMEMERWPTSFKEILIGYIQEWAAGLSD